MLKELLHKVGKQSLQEEKEKNFVVDEYEETARAYENLLENNNHWGDDEDIKKQIVALRSVSGKSTEDICRMFNTGAFNEVCKGYCRVAMEICEVSEIEKNDVLETIDWLFVNMGASAFI